MHVVVQSVLLCRPCLVSCRCPTHRAPDVRRLSSYPCVVSPRERLRPGRVSESLRAGSHLAFHYAFAELLVVLSDSLFRFFLPFLFLPQ